MVRRKRAWLLANAATVLATAVAAGGTAGASEAQSSTDVADNRRLIEEIQGLQERIAELERRSATNARDSQPHADLADAHRVDRTIADVVADAERRSHLSLEGFTAGYSGGRFVIQSEDGNYLFSPSALVQFRYVANFADGVSSDGDGSFESGFEVRRLRLMFEGNFGSPNLSYFFQWNTGVNGGALVMDQAWVRYAFAGTPFAVRFGAYVNGWDHETAVNIGRQLAVDRSVVNYVFSTGVTGVENYVQGIELQYQAVDEWRASVMLHDGYLSRNTNFQNQAATAPAIGIVNPGGGTAGRFEYKLAGDWRDYTDFTARGTKKDLLVVGGGFNFDTADNLNALMYTADVQWEPSSVRGLSVYAAFVGMSRDFRSVPAGQTGSPNDWGFVAQAGYALSPAWEVFGRYSFTKLDDAGPGTLGNAARVNDTIHEIAAGVNYYLMDHAAKFSLDVLFLPEGSPLDMPGIGIIAQPTADPQAAIRAQFQLAI
ncbi:porin family protein [Humisphaera borealis]|uniref:Porin n=1 Tax=Humisphaera borealis TaxID=2807512 RepID=A0A7M2X1J4_9BACT|nr:hypothetical protein [Humisphaera borealis]QOV91563.1 hypothetical protein IPV69_09465 [Humisphaera borealis]